ncbi:hypothetical protein NQ315_007371 [Exocentrus adspersus]|uniref:Cytochrome P450 n=1 Tax=Exocentrus adspersus TaxID=1586481 RepID=A0AAV8VHL5_9CUCU|nr:hypothetical protein NQ315_007371 [Exocentrus adspersus]
MMACLTGSLLTDLVAVFTTLVAVVYAYFKWSYQYWKKRGLPSLEPTIPFGNLPNPMISNVSLAEQMDLLYKDAKSKGWKHCGIYTMARPTWFVLDPDLLKHIFTKDFQQFTDRVAYHNERDDRLTSNMFVLGGARWKQLRTKLSPTFTSGKMKMMFQTMVDCGYILERYIEEDVADKQPIDIKDVLGRFSTDIIGSCAFGLECNTFKEPNSPFRVYGKKIFEGSVLDTAKDAFRLNFPNLARALRMRQFKSDIIDFYSKVVSDTISYREKNNVVRNDFLQMLIELKNKDIAADNSINKLTMDEIIGQSFLFFAAGFETSSTTMTFALFELSTKQEIQDKVREEIRSVLARHDGKISYDSMNELVYMKQVIDETLRKYPALPLLNREAVEDYKVPGEDTIIEKGTSVFIPVMGLHYDKDFFENPQVFDPDRFSAENKKTRHQYCYLPFGEGPRNCIGERFGVLQTKVGLTSLLRNHRITLNAKTKVPLKLDPTSIITTAVGGIWLNVKRV